MTPVGMEIVARARNLLSDARDPDGTGAAAGASCTARCAWAASHHRPLPARASCCRVCGKAYPDLELLLREDTTTNLLKQLEQGSSIWLILALPVEIGGFHSKTVGQDPSTW